MGNNPSKFKGDNLPVETVRWNDIVGTEGTVLYTENGVSYMSDGFCGKLFQKTGKKYRLPTKAEWTYAAKGGTNNDKYEYAGSNNIDEVAWYGGNSGDDTHTVGTKKPNSLGIYDMSGNVKELCDKRSDGSIYGFSCLVCGGCWFSYENDCSLAPSYDNYCSPNTCFFNMGFRLVISE